MRYTTVLFDADGTLLDFSRSEDEAVRETMTLAGITPDDEKVATYSRINDGLWKMLERKEIEKSVLLYRRFELFCEHYGYTADARKMATDYMNLLSQKGYLLDGARELHASGIENVMISLGAKGALLVCDEGVFVAHPPKINAISTIGAGDSSIGGFLAAAAAGKGYAEMLKTAVSYGSAACMSAGTRPPVANDVADVYAKVSVEKL